MTQIFTRYRFAVPNGKLNPTLEIDGQLVTKNSLHNLQRANRNQ